MHSLLMLKENACDKNRNKQYGVVSTISRGYDASCCAVVGRKMGETTACTFAPCGKHKDDCGDDIARKLGYTYPAIRGHVPHKICFSCLPSKCVPDQSHGLSVYIKQLLFFW